MDTVISKPISLLSKFSEAKIREISNELKLSYDHLKAVEDLERLEKRPGSTAYRPLQELVVDGFDLEQIWQQIELQNNNCRRWLRKRLLADEPCSIFNADASDGEKEADDERSSATHSELDSDTDDDLNEIFARANANDVKGSDSEDEDGEDGSLFGDFNEDALFVDSNDEDDDEKDGDDEDKDIDENAQTSSAYQHYDSVVDDKFFRLSEMEEFLEQQERGNDKTAAGLDFFAHGVDTEEFEENNYRYSDFFDAPGDKKKRVHFASDGQADPNMVAYNENGDTAGVDTTKPKSAFEQRQEKLKKQIEDLEQNNLQEKPWQLKGEIVAKSRPENSLLTEHLDFDHGSKQKPLVTEETTQKLEDIIKQRIADQAYDDVERKIKPVDEPKKFLNELTVSQEKSTLSLAELYEQQYMKKTVDLETPAGNPQHEEIRKAMKDLFAQLDLLSAYHYAPKPMVPELKVVNNMPTVTVEEVAPVTVSNSTMMAPEEVKKKQIGELKVKEELTRPEKKKALKRKKQKHGTSNPIPKDKMKTLRKVARVKIGRKTDRSAAPKTSEQFFKKLQTEVINTMNKGVQPKKKKRRVAAGEGATYKI